MSLRTTTTTIVVGIVTLLLLCSAKSTLGFTLPQPSSTRTHHRDGQLKLSVVDLQQPLQDAVTHYQYHHGANMDVLHSTTTSTLVSAAADAAAEKGWWGTAWGAYVNVFRNTLDGVHNTIDGPLRAVGIEQTWGPSIAIFTMSAYKVPKYFLFCVCLSLVCLVLISFPPFLCPSLFQHTLSGAQFVGAAEYSAEQVG